MAAQKGKDVLLKMLDGATYVSVAGLRTRRLTLNAEAVDITHSESAGRWRELLAGAGVRRLTLNGGGVFLDDASAGLVRQTFFDGVARDCQLIIPSFGRIEGAFVLTTLEYRGDHGGEVTFELTLESAGALTFTAI
jgi:TP901-1 family phage major tail protein